MNKFKLSFVVLALSCCLVSCKSSKQPNLSIKINEYSSYQEMVEVEQTNYVNDYKEKNKILFELGTDGFNTKYYIGGICYCPLEYKKMGHVHEKTENCPNLRYRELFIEFYDNDNCVTLIYKDELDFDLNTLSWKKSDGGNCYRYEKHYSDKEQYILKDEHYNVIVGLKLLKEDETLKQFFFDRITEQLNMSI